MANFKVSVNGDDIDQFDIPVGRKIKLVQWGGDASGKQLDVALEGTVPTITLKVEAGKLPAASTAFTVEGSASGVTADISACVSGGRDRYSKDLRLNVKNEAKKHPGYDFDLISDLATKGNTEDLYNYSRMMTDPEPILKQDTTAGHYNCGTVSENYGPKFFHNKTSVTYFAYYLSPTSDKMADLRFDPKRMAASIALIQNLVRQGIPVRVWIVHDDGFGKVISETDPTHFVAIVGYGGNRFLYIDPWPSGSALGYNGNMYPPRTTSPTFFGQFEFDPGHLELGIRNSPTSKGSMSYVVVAGP